MTQRFRLVFVAAYWLATAQAQPIGCVDDDHCPTGFFCEETYFCRECIHCSELNRLPGTDAQCTKSVVDCGPCYDGLVEDHLGNIHAKCVSASLANSSTDSPSGENGVGGVASYVWVIVGAVLLIALFLIVGITLFFLVRSDTKIRTSMLTSVRSVFSGQDPAHTEPPPPYSAPSPTAPPCITTSNIDDEESSAFIKRLSLSSPNGGASRETADRQAARVFSNPSYVRTNSLPPGYSEPPDMSPFSPHDEDTMESPWTAGPPADAPDHNGNANHLDGNGASSSLAQSSLAVLPTLAIQSQDSNNNRSAEINSTPNGGAPSPPSFGGVAAPLTIMVVQNINTGHQRNEVK